MKNLLLAILFTISCAHTEQPSKPSNTEIETLKKKVRDLEEQIDYLSYEQTNRYCFNFKDVCYLQAYDFCQQNNKSTCLQKAQQQCFQKHEECIVANYHHWQDIKKAKGYK